MDRRPSSALLALALIGVVGPIAAVMVSTVWGIGITPDSVSYIGGARGLLAGDGFSMPGPTPTAITHFPPLYSLWLATVGAADVDVLTAARWCGAGAFAGNILIVGWLLARLRGSRTQAVDGFTIFGMLLMLTSTTMLEIHTMAWSEPLFILCGLLGFIWLVRWIEEDRAVFLVLGALALGLALVTRYAGVAYWGTGLLAVVFLGRGPWQARLKAAAAFALIAALPIGTWMARNMALAGTTTNRTLYFHVPNITLVWEGVATLSSWLLIPNSLPTLVRGLALSLFAAMIVILYVFVWRSRGRDRQPQDARALRTVLHLFGLFIPVYAATLLLSNSVLRAYTPMEARILSPLFPPLLILVLDACRRGVQAAPAWPVRSLVAGIGVLFAAVSLARAAAYVRQGHSDGLGFNSRLWHQSETLQRLRDMPAAAVYSNAPEAIYIHLNRPALRLPRSVGSATGLENPNYIAESNAMQRAIDEGAYVVLFRIPWRESPDGNPVERLRLRPVVQAEDGTVFAAHAGDGI